MVLFDILYPGATHLNYLDFFVCLFIILAQILLALTSLFSANTVTFQYTQASPLWYSGLEVVGEYHVGLCSTIIITM